MKDNLFGLSSLTTLLSYVTIIYVVGIVIYFVLRLTMGERTVYVVIGNIFLHYVLIAAPILLIVTISLRMWWQSTALLVLALVFVSIYGGRFLPKTQMKTFAGTTLVRVMSYNTAAHYISAQDLVTQIETHKADIVALIELDGDNRDVLKDQLIETYPYQVFEGSGISGKGILSRYPINEHEAFTLVTDRKNLYTKINVNEQIVEVYALHPPSPDYHDGFNFYRPDPNNNAEITLLLQRVSSEVPTLLLGDFNITEHTPSYKQIERAGFVDSYRTAGYGFGSTFYLDWGWQLPIIRIDYIWHSDHFHAAHAYVGAPMTSDHAPLVAELLLK